MAAWKTQYERALRALGKVERADGDKTAQLDDILCFFQNCWHLKDWIRNDDTLSQSVRDAIAKDAENAENLKFCADLANGSKHLKLTRNERKGAKLFHIESISTIDSKGEVISKVPIGYVVASKQGSPKPGDVIGFAREAVKDWKRILKDHGLQT